MKIPDSLLKVLKGGSLPKYNHDKDVFYFCDDTEVLSVEDFLGRHPSFIASKQPVIDRKFGIVVPHPKHTHEALLLLLGKAHLQLEILPDINDIDFWWDFCVEIPFLINGSYKEEDRFNKMSSYQDSFFEHGYAVSGARSLRKVCLCSRKRVMDDVDLRILDLVGSADFDYV